MNVRPVTLSGKLVRLEPLSQEHLPDLVLAGQDPHIWQYLLYGPVTSEERMLDFIDDLLGRQAKGTDLPFATIHIPSGKAVGMTRYMDIQPRHRGLEIGGTWISPQFQRTGVNTEAKYLMLVHAFEVLHAIRVQIKTDLRNERSQRAIERLGAVREGVLPPGPNWRATSRPSIAPCMISCSGILAGRIRKTCLFG